MAIISDNEVEIKKLSKPIKRTVITSATRINFEEDLALLNEEETTTKKGIPKRTSFTKKAAKTLIGNLGPDKNGKIDWKMNPDCVDYILQYHESYNHENTPEGFLKTGERCYRQFDKLFKAKVTKEEIALTLEQKYGTDITAIQGEPNLESKLDPEIEKPKAPEPYYPLTLKTLSLEKDKTVLEGMKFEICKILKCKNICLIQKTRGKEENNKLFYASCKVSTAKGGIDSEQCPQEKEMSAKEEFVYQMFLQQFNGNELQAKKFVYLSKMLQSSKK